MYNEEKRNVIEGISHNCVTKEDLISLINATFPNEEGSRYSQIAEITTVTMTDGTTQQSIVFGKQFKI